MHAAHALLRAAIAAVLLSSACADGQGAAAQPTSPTAAQAMCTTGLFAPTTRTGDTDHAATRGLMRSRRVEIDFAALRRAVNARQPMAFNLFDDACVVAQPAEPTVNAPDQLVVTGPVIGGQEGTRVSLAVSGPAMSASIVANGPLFFQVQYAGNGVHTVMQIDPAAFPPD